MNPAKAPHSRVTSHFGAVQHACWETLNCRGLWFEEVNDNNFTAVCILQEVTNRSYLSRIQPCLS